MENSKLWWEIFEDTGDASAYLIYKLNNQKKINSDEEENSDQGSFV